MSPGIVLGKEAATERKQVLFSFLRGGYNLTL